jgi:chromosomal replication initiator protein
VPRQIAMYLAKQMTEASLPEIGRQFGGKHHTTVMHSIAKIDEQRRADKDLNRTINKLQGFSYFFVSSSITSNE